MTQPTGPRRPTFAIAAHLYYAELWPELAAMIRHAPEPFALYVTMPQSSGAAPAVLADFPDAIIRPVPNLGRDIGPFVWLLPELMAYDLVCKIHSKRYTAWRIEGVRGVLGGPDLIERTLSAFANSQELMMAGSGALYIDGYRYMYVSGERVRAFQPDLPKAFGFFAGTMFWTRPHMFADFGDAFPIRYFVPHSDGDGQLEHVIERLFGVRVATLGGSVGLTRIVDSVPTVEIVPAGEPRPVDLEALVYRDMPQRYAAYPADWYIQRELIEGAPLGAFAQPGAPKE